MDFLPNFIFAPIFFKNFALFGMQIYQRLLLSDQRAVYCVITVLTVVIAQGNEDILSMLKDADVGQVGDQAESRLALIHKDPHKKSLYAGQALSLNVNS